MTACVFCGGDLDQDPIAKACGLRRIPLRCLEHEAAICPWCLMCQGAEITEDLKARARAKREDLELTVEIWAGGIGQ